MSKRLNLLNEMVKETPEDPFLHYAIALEFEKFDLKQSIDHLQKIRSRFPEYLGTFLKLGQLLELTDDFDEATEVYREGIVLAKIQRNQKAIHEISQALELIIIENEF